MCSERLGNFNVKEKMKDISFFLSPGSLKMLVPFRLLKVLFLCAHEHIPDEASPVNRFPIAKQGENTQK